MTDYGRVLEVLRSGAMQDTFAEWDRLSREEEEERRKRQLEQQRRGQQRREQQQRQREREKLNSVSDFVSPPGVNMLIVSGDFFAQVASPKMSARESSSQLRDK